MEEFVRRLLVRIVTGIACIMLAAAAWLVALHSAPNFAVQAQTAKPAVASQSAAQVVPASTTVSVPTAATPGSELYTAKRGEAIPAIARHYLSRTSYLTSSELADAIRAANHISTTASILKANQQIVIPGVLSAPISEHTVPVARDFEVRAIYLTGVMAASDHGLRIIQHWREVGGNAVVFDVKDSDGNINIPFDHPFVGDHHVYMHDVPKFVHFLHQQNMHAIARIAIFRDEHLVTTHPELAVQSHKNHTAWRENGKLVWTDPSSPKVQDYNIALARHVASLGVDEIQFDYVRFPAEGDQKDASFVFQEVTKEKEQAPAGTETQTQKAVILTAASAAGGTVRQTSSQPQPAGSQPASKTTNQTPRTATNPDTSPTLQRSAVIAAFLQHAYSELHPTGVLLSLDVFGVMAWQRPVDLSHTGQDIVQMAKYCDVLSPMIYPSHFFGMDHVEHPGDEPVHFIGESMDRFELITKGSGVVIRPWLQAFHWRTKTYSPEYIKIQVETAKAKGGIGFLFWNAANDYSKPFTAMPEMKEVNDKEGSKQNPKYFRGDELPTPTVRAAFTHTSAP